MTEKRCSRCVLPDSYPGIVFDDKGVCQLCRSYRKPEVKGEREPRHLMRSEKGAKYECVATLSGGRDSTYVLYSAVKILGLNILSVSYDNGFRHVQSMKNARNACEVLGVDLLEFRSRDDLNARITAHALHVSIPFGPGAACKLMCRLCYNGGLAFVCSVAEKYEIPFVLWGDSLIKKISFIPVRDTFLKFRSPLRYLLSKRGPSFVRFLRLLIEQRNESLPSETSGLM